MNNPELYDKMEDEYSITIDKLEKLNVLSNYLKQLQMNKEGLVFFSLQYKYYFLQ